jgi:hypothetical protein
LKGQKQEPSLPDSVDGSAKNFKPPPRLTEREIAAYADLNRIDNVIEECLTAKGAKMLVYKKDVLNWLETESPGTKPAFYWGFLDREEKARRIGVGIGVVA